DRLAWLDHRGDPREAFLEPRRHRLRRLAEVDNDRERRHLVRALRDRLHDAEREHDAAVDERIAAVVDARDPKRPLAGVDDAAGAQAVDPRRAVADERLVSARPPARDDDEPPLGKLAGGIAEEERRVAALDRADEQ